MENVNTTRCAPTSINAEYIRTYAAVAVRHPSGRIVHAHASFRGYFGYGSSETADGQTTAAHIAAAIEMAILQLTHRVNDELTALLAATPIIDALASDSYSGPTRGRGLNRQRFFSICSAHRTYAAGCPRCERGQYVNVYRQRLSSAIYNFAPRIWRWWVNR